MKKLAVTLTLALLAASQGAFGFSFWDIIVGVDTYEGKPMLTFSQPGEGIQYQVGAYEYTRVGAGAPIGPFPAASPGIDYPALSRACDAMGLFFKPEDTLARFMVITGMPEGGFTASQVGYGGRQFGPGDLRLQIGSAAYGIGLRQGGLLWALDPSSTHPWFQVYDPLMNPISMTARDAGNKGQIVLAPQWAHVDNHLLTPGDPRGYAFFVAGTGSNVGSASVNVFETDVLLGETRLFAYEVAVPWSAIGIDPADYDFTASWAPDCGNDIITSRFTTPVVPEPFSVVLAILGLGAAAAYRRIR